MNKIIHQIWIGEHTIPDKFIKYCKDMEEVHSDYEYIFWDNNKIDEYFKNDEFHIFHKSIGTVESYRTNYYRLKILQDFGGWYIDVDSIVIKSLNGIEFNEPFLIGLNGINYEISVLYSDKGNLLLNDLLKCFEFDRREVIENYQSFKSFHMKNIKVKLDNRNDVKILSRNYFYGRSKAHSVFIHSTFYSSHSKINPRRERRPY